LVILDPGWSTTWVLRPEGSRFNAGFLYLFPQNGNPAAKAFCPTIGFDHKAVAPGMFRASIQETVTNGMYALRLWNGTYGGRAEGRPEVAPLIGRVLWHMVGAGYHSPYNHGARVVAEVLRGILRSGPVGQEPSIDILIPRSQYIKQTDHYETANWDGLRAFLRDHSGVQVAEWGDPAQLQCSSSANLPEPPEVADPRPLEWQTPSHRIKL